MRSSAHCSFRLLTGRVKVVGSLPGEDQAEAARDTRSGRLVRAGSHKIDLDLPPFFPESPLRDRKVTILRKLRASRRKKPGA